MKDTQHSSWVFWSTRESVTTETPSITAMFETLAVVPASLWLAFQYDFVRLYILTGAAIAPLVLLRSPQAEALGVRWFLGFEGSLNRWLNPDRRILGVSLFFVHDALFMLLFMVITGAGIVVLALQEGTTLGRERYWMCFLPIALLIVRSGVWYHWRDRFFVSYILTLCGISSAIILLFILVGPAFHNAIVVAIIIGAVLCFVLMFGVVLTLLCVLWFIRMISNIVHVTDGIRCVPENFRKLILCTSPIHEPELVPGLAGRTDRLSIGTLNKLYLTNPRGDWTDYFSGRKIFGLLIGLLFAPAWLYRLTLKSTAWLWWPLSFLSEPPSLAKNPDWFHARITQTRWSRHLRALAYASILAFLAAGIWHEIAHGRLPENPFISIIGYAFLIDWSATPWQLLGFSGAVISLSIVYLVDWSYQKYQIGQRTGDVGLADDALRQLNLIERLSRLRTIMFLVYCGLVGLQAFLVFNTRGCWVELSPSTRSWSEMIYGNMVPTGPCKTRAPDKSS